MTLPVVAKTVTFPYLGREFTLVIPEKAPEDKKPLLVLLHGCKQSSEIILKGTELNEAALQNNFYILSPEQSFLDNVDHCWNWFMGFNQMRGSSNEMGQIMAAIHMVAASQKIDRERIYLAGMSAGGVMAHNLATCYPDVFSGAAIHSGLSYKIAENIFEAQTVLTASKLKSPNYLGKRAWECARHVPQRRLNRMIMIHGDLDSRVDPYHTELISKVNEVQMDYLDDGKRNRSQVFIEKEISLSFRNGYSATRIDRSYSSVPFTERLYLIQGLGHAWGGGKAISTNFDPEAPSSNDFILKFFQLKK